MPQNIVKFVKGPYASLDACILKDENTLYFSEDKRFATLGNNVLTSEVADISIDSFGNIAVYKIDGSVKTADLQHKQKWYEASTYDDLYSINASDGDIGIAGSSEELSIIYVLDGFHDGSTILDTSLMYYFS